MGFEMFTEHEVELFALHINFFNLNEFFLSICMQHTDKNLPRKWLFGGIFWYCVLQGRWSFQGLLPPEPPPELCPGPTGGLIAAPTEPAAPGNEIRSLYIVLSAGFHCHPCPYDKFVPPL